MKIRKFISVFLIMAVLIIAGSCATGKKAYVAQEDEELYGTWVNPEYNPKIFEAKWIYNPDGTLEMYTTDFDTRIFGQGNFTIYDRWTDSEGNIWYKFFIHSLRMQGTRQGPEFYYLVKINSSHETLEGLWTGTDYPTEFDKNNLHYNYVVFYRQ